MWYTLTYRYTHTCTCTYTFTLWYLYIYMVLCLVFTAPPHMVCGYPQPTHPPTHAPPHPPTPHHIHRAEEYIDICVYTYIYVMYIVAHTHTIKHVYIHVFINIHIHIYIYISTYLPIYLSTYLSIYLSIYLTCGAYIKRDHFDELHEASPATAAFPATRGGLPGRNVDSRGRRPRNSKRERTLLTSSGLSRSDDQPS